MRYYMTRDELIALRQRAANLSSQDVVRAAEASGYVLRGTRGGHQNFVKPGVRTLVIQKNMRPGMARAIINRLIRDLEE